MRVPEVGSGDFRLGSQVIVRESQRAVFYRDGKSLDLFEPGRHTITTLNLPVLSGLLRMGTGGQDIFTAEVFFANMREFTDMKWGTPEPISLRDTDLGLVRLRGFGHYTMTDRRSQAFCRSVRRHAGHVPHRPDQRLPAQRHHQPHDRHVGREYDQYSRPAPPFRRAERGDARHLAG